MLGRGGRAPGNWCWAPSRYGIYQPIQNHPILASLIASLGLSGNLWGLPRLHFAASRYPNSALNASRNCFFDSAPLESGSTQPLPVSSAETHDVKGTTGRTNEPYVLTSVGAVCEALASAAQVHWQPWTSVTVQCENSDAATPQPAAQSICLDRRWLDESMT